MKITKTDTEIRVSSEYHQDLPSAARALGGKWNAQSSEWIFDARTEIEVKSLYEEVYGEYGVCGDLVTIRFCLKEDIYAGKKSIFVCGKKVARAWGRDFRNKDCRN